MIGTIDIKVNAAKPNFPLLPIYAFIGSPSQVRIINVPKAIGKWAVTAVQITANYPDNTSRSVSCTLVGGCWSATLPASTAVGQSLMGFKVTASGTDETGAAVTGYVLGKGDVFILNDDSTITIGSTTYYVHLLDAQPTYPKKGDLCLIGGAWKIYNGTEWIAFGGGTGDVRHAEFSDMTADLDPDESSMGDVMTKVNTLITKLRGTSAALVALLALGSFAAVEVQTAALKSLPGKTMIVTNITGAVDQTITNGLCSVAAAQAMADAKLAKQYDDDETNGKLTWEQHLLKLSGAGFKADSFTSTGQFVAGTESDYTWSGGNLSDKADKATTLAGYGITDALGINDTAAAAKTLNDGAGHEVVYFGGWLFDLISAYVVTAPTVYVQKINNGGEISVPFGKTGTLAVVADIPQNAVTYASGDPTTAAEILSSAENTAGTIASNLVDHTNVRFSNEVLAVGLGIGTNEVAQINAILNEMGETPISEATTIGALLAALAAAVAWLKKKSVKKDSNGYYFED